MRYSRQLNGTLYASLVVLLFGLPLASQAQEEGEYVLRTYEVGDLTLNVSDRPYGESTSPTYRGFQGGGGGQFSVPEVANQLSPYLAQFGGGGGGMAHGAFVQVGAPASTNSMGSLIEVMIATVDPDSWTENGGGIGEVRPFGTALVVWQTEPVHQRIEQLLQALRAGTGDRRTVKVDARWLLLNSDDLAQLTAEDRHDLSNVNRQVLERFTRRATSIRGLTQCFSGQLVYVVSGTQRNIVSSYIPVVGSADSPQADEQLVAQDRKATFRFASETQSVPTQQSGVGYQPIVQKKNFGALLEIRPTLVPGSKTAVVDLTATITVPGKQLIGHPGEIAASQGPPFVDRIAIETQQLATTLRVPLTKPVVVGGLTYQPASIPMARPGDPAAGEPLDRSAESPQLYLILQVQ